MKAAVVTTLLTCIFASAGANAVEQESRQTTVIVVIGAAGTPEFAQQFADWAHSWQHACTKGDADFVAIGLDPNATSDDRDILRDKLAEETQETKAELWLVLIGHGTFDGRTAKFNLRGPDVSAKDLAEWLDPMLRPTAVINCASASAPFLVKLSAPGRIIITATKSGFEHNYARFGQYMSDAIAAPEADLDKDDQTSLLEAFLTASGRVDEFYAAEGRLVTEHALLDDNGDGLGTRADWFRGIRPIKKAQDDAPLDGYRAHQFHLILSQAERSMPLDLRAQRDRLELEVIKLRDRKEEISEDEYYSKLEALLYQITLIYEQTEESNISSE